MRVLELSERDEAAAYCGKLYARWGAEVIRVESLYNPLMRSAGGTVRPNPAAVASGVGFGYPVQEMDTSALGTKLTLAVP